MKNARSNIHNVSVSHNGSKRRGASESVTVNCVARPTSVVDVVRGWEYNEQGEKVKVEGALGAENIYAEELSAISVNWGVSTPEYSKVKSKPEKQSQM